MASDIKLEEIINNNIKFYSINQAVKAGLDLYLTILAGVDSDEEKIIIWEESDEDFWRMEIL